MDDKFFNDIGRIAMSSLIAKTEKEILVVNERIKNCKQTIELMKSHLGSIELALSEAERILKEKESQE